MQKIFTEKYATKQQMVYFYANDLIIQSVPTPQDFKDTYDQRDKYPEVFVHLVKIFRKV